MNHQIVDPYGKVMAQCHSIDDKAADELHAYQLGIADLDMSQVEQVRNSMPLNH